MIENLEGGAEPVGEANQNSGEDEEEEESDVDSDDDEDGEYGLAYLDGDDIQVIGKFLVLFGCKPAFSRIKTLDGNC